MAKLILKSPYIKSTGGASGYLKYIATRERVEIIPDDRPPTRKQEQFITKLVKDFPEVKDLYEYGDYMDKPTKANASAFITLALESNWDALHESDQYMKYIATRPRAERLGEHGLFGDDAPVSLDAAMNEFIDKAVSFYADWLSANRNDMLPMAIASAMNGRLKILEKNLSSLSFRYAVELDMLMGIIADTMQLDRDDLKRRRAQSVKNVRQTNGRVSLEKRAQLWDEDDWSDDEWQS